MSGKQEELLGPFPPDKKIGFLVLMSALIRFFNVPTTVSSCNDPIRDQTDATDCDWIFLGNSDPQAVRSTIKLLLEICMTLFFEDYPRKHPTLTPAKLPVLQKRITGLFPNAAMQGLMQAARKRDIPFYRISRGNIWQFGQGANGRHHLPTANEADSYTGATLAANKILSNDFIEKLGFPGVRHAMVLTVAHATRVAGQLGYPIVIKPVNSSMGKGVTVGIADVSEIADAVAEASRFSSRGVLVERYVDGTVHRLAVFGGKLAWASAKYPARVFGDGQQTILELIEAENVDRIRHPDLKPIVPDRGVKEWLAKKGRSLQDRPGKGEEVRLRSVANIAMGGERHELTDIHPDNVEMAESIAAAFRMDAMGIDFISQDLSRSWRDVPCAIIEVNETPAVSNNELAERVLENTISTGQPVRIPSILLVECAQDIVNLATDRIGRHGSRIGVVSDQVWLDGNVRDTKSAGLKARVDSLILNPRCDAIVVTAGSDDLLKEGLPLDRFDLIIHPPSLADPLRILLEQHCGRVFVVSGGERDSLIGALEAIRRGQ